MAKPLFSLILRKTYFNLGFFNVTVAFERYVTSSNEDVALYVGSHKQHVHGRVSRKYNNNGTPRVFGGTELRDWFHKNFELLDTVKVEFLSPTKIWLHD